MSDYARLADFLARQKSDHWDASFAVVEQVIGRPLPPSASKYPAWWANQSGTGHSQTVGWRSVGWKTAALDLPHRRVRFIRDRKRVRDGQTTAPRPSLEALWARAEELTANRDRNAVMRIALEGLIAREAASQLAALGGMMPDFRMPPRERA